MKYTVRDDDGGNEKEIRGASATREDWLGGKFATWPTSVAATLRLSVSQGSSYLHGIPPCLPSYHTDPVTHVVDSLAMTSGYHIARFNQTPRPSNLPLLVLAVRIP
jgi:hypothetical protein